MSAVSNEKVSAAKTVSSPELNDAVGRLVVVFKRNGQQAIGRIDETSTSDMYWFSGLRLIVASLGADGQGRTSLIPYFPPYVVAPPSDLAPIEAEAIELMLPPQPQLEAAWVQSTSRIQISGL